MYTYWAKKGKMIKVLTKGPNFAYLKPLLHAFIGVVFFKRKTNQQQLYAYVANVCTQHKEGKIKKKKNRVFSGKCSRRALGIFT